MVARTALGDERAVPTWVWDVMWAWLLAGEQRCPTMTC